MPMMSFAKLLLVVITPVLLYVQVRAIVIDIDNPRAYTLLLLFDPHCLLQIILCTHATSMLSTLYSPS